MFGLFSAALPVASKIPFNLLNMDQFIFLASIGTFLLNVILFKLPWKASRAAKFYNVLFLFLVSLIAYGLR